jgi:hypothetical protein
VASVIGPRKPSFLSVVPTPGKAQAAMPKQPTPPKVSPFRIINRPAGAPANPCIPKDLGELLNIIYGLCLSNENKNEPSGVIKTEVQIVIDYRLLTPGQIGQFVRSLGRYASFLANRLEHPESIQQDPDNVVRLARVITTGETQKAPKYNYTEITFRAHSAGKLRGKITMDLAQVSGTGDNTERLVIFEGRPI